MKDLLYKFVKNEKVMYSNNVSTHFNEGQRLHNKPYNYDWYKILEPNDKKVIPMSANQIYQDCNPLRKDHMNI